MCTGLTGLRAGGRVPERICDFDTSSHLESDTTESLLDDIMVTSIKVVIERDMFSRVPTLTERLKSR